MSTSEFVDGLRVKAGAVAASHAERQRAHEEARAAMASIIAAVAEAVRPALAAMGSPIVGALHGPLDGRPDDRDRRFLFDGTRRMRGVHVGGGPEFGGRTTGGVTGIRSSGVVRGRALYLLDEWTLKVPEFVELRYDGTWSDDEGVFEWVAEHDRLAAKAAVERGWTAEPIVEKLAEELEAQANSKGDRRAEKMLRDAERLRAVELLLRGPR